MGIDQHSPVVAVDQLIQHQDIDMGVSMGDPQDGWLMTNPKNGWMMTGVAQLQVFAPTISNSE